MVKDLGWLLLNAAQTLATWLWTGVWITLALLAWVGSGFSRSLPLWLARSVWAPGMYRLIGGQLTVERPEGVDWEQPHVYLMNHQSMADIPAAFMAVPAGLVFIAKQVLQYVPFLGWYMTAMGMVFVDRRAGERAVRSLQRAGAQIRAGRSVLAFPEGTRTPDGRVLPFKKGPFLVALEAGVPIVPMAIVGARELLRPGGYRFRPAAVRVKLGQPIPTAGLQVEDRDELIRLVRTRIIELHLELGGAGGELHTAIAPRAAEAIGGEPVVERGTPSAA